jgi:peptidoglycan/LPS O-acetylase OafA/YrhL
VSKRRASKKSKTDGSLPYLPGLDGLRALAVIGVLLYHADLGWTPGGFLGVEVFFVISGYLITSLLLAEWNRRGSISFKAFWLRRARRLLPALFLVIASVLAFAIVFLPQEVAGLRGDALAAIGYVTNWYLIFSHKSYFEVIGRPPMLRHLWSLAIEEQFYLLFPLLFTAGMKLLRRRRMLFAVIAGAVASTALMAILYQPDVDPSRVYYGTDTRASALLIGVALAFLWAPEKLQGRPTRRSAPWLDVIGFGALAALFGFYRWLDEFQPFLCRGGFVSVALITSVLIAVAVHPRARLLPRLLGQKVLRWIGQRSYGIYLWHWPVFMVTRPQLDVLITGLPLLILRLAVTVVIAELSYRFIEMPIRTGALGRTWKALREARGVPRWQLGIQWAGVSVAIVVLSIVIGASVANAHPPATPTFLSVESIDTVSMTSTPTVAAEIAPTPTVVPSAGEEITPTVTAEASPTPEALPSTEPEITLTASVPVTPTPTAAAEPTLSPLPLPTDMPSGKPGLASLYKPTPTATATSVPISGTQVTAIGDSVMLSAASQLQQAMPGIRIDAAVGRQVSTSINILRAHQAAGRLGSVVVIHLGDNGTFTAKQFDEIMQILAGAHRVVFMNVKVPRPWEGPDNTVLAEGVKRYPNAVLVDWHTASSDRPELFWTDGIHLRPEGAQFYASLVAAAIQAP